MLPRQPILLHPDLLIKCLEMLQGGVCVCVGWWGGWGGKGGVCVTVCWLLVKHFDLLF